jgi:hypothetical protein
MRILTLLIWALTGLVGVLSAETFEERLAALQNQLTEQPTNKDVLFKLGDLCHDEGVHDNPKAVVLADNYFKRLIALDPTNALARAMHGSTMTMVGRDAFWPTKRVALVREGNREMDEAVAMAPQDVRVRFARANNNFYMPKFLGREEIVRADLNWLWEQVQAKTDIPMDIRQDTALLQGLSLKKRKQTAEAVQVWRKALEWSPNSAEASDIRSNLAKTNE